ncbi:hypothetical protein [Natronorubrum daqingense]|uniref:Uncharacterized protein n=1 Tax=Natronorubrum daqingense TaxID=588898 RepID=A0A1N6YLS4_9EURY|nr:hypothetical protein [Natronorubrum daqingense]APX95627.1 hypothetical protein BB347_02805 [Natronorubrum daqingense]SIR15411.1 hypothetical protein SAMN05421809_0485 [Natronorubrum daqingense]
MADYIEFREGAAVFIEETFGGLEASELTVNRDKFSEYELHLNVEGTVPLDELIASIHSNGVELNVSSFKTSVVEIREADAEVQDCSAVELTQSLKQTNRSNMPPIPDDDGLKTPTDNAHYQRLVENTNSQPAKYRRLIRNEDQIARPKFDRWAKRQGFAPETGGSHNASLLMLERIGEIERRGRGDDQVIIWVGE